MSTLVKTKNLPLFIPIKSLTKEGMLDAMRVPNYTTLFQKSIKNNKIS